MRICKALFISLLLTLAFSCTVFADEKVAAPDAVKTSNVTMPASTVEDYMLHESGSEPIYNRIVKGHEDYRSKLGKQEKIIYDTLMPMVEAVADGRRESTVFEIPYVESGLLDQLTFSAEELGLDYLRNGDDVNPDAFRCFREKINQTNPLRAIRAMMYDKPYEFYWFDKTVGYEYLEPYVYTMYDKDRGCDVIGYKPGYPMLVTLYVNKEYSQEKKTLTTMVDKDTTELPKAAAAYAAQIVKDNKNLGDYEKLCAYKDIICNLTDYHDDIDSVTDYGDPWQLVWVFDKDPDTKVVCEGYAKAFQLLCDLSTFNHKGVKCHLLAGITANAKTEEEGNHMWNMVRMEDGKLYLVDVTNCDEGTIGFPDVLFMKGCESWEAEYRTFSFNFGSYSFSYTYDRGLATHYEIEDLAPSTTDYVPFNCQHDLEKVEAVPATCTKVGHEAYWHCVDCDMLFSDEDALNEVSVEDMELPELEHEWGDYVTEKPATCTVSGREAIYCVNCNLRKTGRAIPAFGHDWDEGVISVSPTDVNTGVRLYTCQHDSEHTREEMEPPTGKESDISCGFFNGMPWRIDKDGVLHVGAPGEELHFTGEITSLRASSWPWYGNRNDITAVVIDGTVHAPKRCNYMFGSLLAAKTIDMTGLVTDSINSAGHMFASDISLETLNLSTFDISHVAANNRREMINGVPITCRYILGEKALINSDTTATDKKRPSDRTTKLRRVALPDGTPTCAPVLETMCDYDGSHAGVYQYHVYTEDIEHPWGEGTSVSEATCETDGETEFTCSVCGDKKIEKETAFGHEWKDGVVTTEPSCCREGVKTFVCKHDADHVRTESIPMTDHVYDDEWVVNKEPTCLAKGQKMRSCLYCESKEYEPIDALGHVEAEEFTVEIAPTCTERGKDNRLCTRCSEVLAVRFPPALGHEWDAGTITEAPTCTSAGKKLLTCTRDHSHTKEVSVAATGHDFGGWEEIPSSCTGEGSKRRACNTCGFMETQSLPAAGHAWESDYTVDMEADCEKDGSKSIHCKNCIATKQNTIIPALGHVWNESDRVAPTCVKDGYVKYVCSKDSSHKKTDVLASKGHSMGPWQTRSVATCTQDGLKVRDCSACDFQERSVTTAKGHVWGRSETVPSTCETAGSFTRFCDNCDETDSVILPPSGHQLKTSLMPATLSANGHVCSTCTVCNSEIEKTEIARPAQISLTSGSFVYDTKPKTPGVIVKDVSGKTIGSAWYTVTYSRNKEVGTAAAKVTFNGNYSGEKVLSFTINPPGTKLAKIKAAKKSLNVGWKKQAKASGYIIQLSTNKSFSSKVKTVTVTKKTSKKIKGLKAKKKYYIRVRAFTTTGGKRYFSSWSPVKTKKVK